VSFIFILNYFTLRVGHKGVDRYPSFLGARPGIITDALASVQAINVYEVEESSFVLHVRLGPLCQSFLSFRFKRY
jgi:hypothetical protein